MVETIVMVGATFAVILALMAETIVIAGTTFVVLLIL